MSNVAAKKQSEGITPELFDHLQPYFIIDSIRAHLLFQRKRATATRPVGQSAAVSDTEQPAPQAAAASAGAIRKRSAQSTVSGLHIDDALSRLQQLDAARVNEVSFGTCLTSVCAFFRLLLTCLSTISCDETVTTVRNGGPSSLHRAGLSTITAAH